MKYRKEKLERLARVAHLYYEENKTQGEIADMLRVSRPLVSRMLNEARSIGIVEIRVRSLTSTPEILTEHLCQTYGLHSGTVVPDEESDDVTHYAMAQRLLTYIYEQNPAVVGVGWGTVIGLAAKRLESIQVPPLSIQTICPLLGNSNVLSRQYHPDEHVPHVRGGVRRAAGLSARPCVHLQRGGREHVPRDRAVSGRGRPVGKAGFGSGGNSRRLDCAAHRLPRTGKRRRLYRGLRHGYRGEKWFPCRTPSCAFR